jgi:hypothetical protein
MASVLKDEADPAGWYYNLFGNSVHTYSDLPDTASFGSVQQQRAFDSRRHGPDQTGNDEDESEADLHNDCEVYPMHALGGGSSLARHGKNDGHAAVSQPVSDTTLSFLSLGGTWDFARPEAPFAWCCRH